jgi:hypothetical protein
MAHRRSLWVIGFAMLAVFGCAEASRSAKQAASPAERTEEPMMAKQDTDGIMLPSPTDERVRQAGGAQDKKPAAGEPAKKPAAPVGAPADPAAVSASPAPPMIIYNATLDVIVKDLDAATPEVEKLVAGHKGFVAKSEVKGDTGSRRTATYTLRVPVAVFNPVKEGLVALGTPERNVVDTQDVTEEFVDVEARIKNLKEQEDKLNELLKEKRKEEKLEDVIKVSDRIYQVRGDIERAQGRRNYLQNRVQLSTLTVTLREIKDYKPPSTPTFGSQISETFGKSWEALLDFGQALVLIAVALAPWAPLWLPALIALAWATRRLIHLSRESPVEQERERPRRSRRDAEEPGADVEVVEAQLEAEPTESERPPEEPRPPA